MSWRSVTWDDVREPGRAPSLSWAGIRECVYARDTTYRYVIIDWSLPQTLYIQQQVTP